MKRRSMVTKPIDHSNQLPHQFQPPPTMKRKAVHYESPDENPDEEELAIGRPTSLQNGTLLVRNQTPTANMDKNNMGAGAAESCPQSVRVPKKAPSLTNPGKEMVTIHVLETAGKKTTFVEHKSFLCHYSPFFKATFNGNSREAETQTMNYTNTTEAAFKLMTNWIYTQKLDDVEENKAYWVLDDLVELWLLADRLAIPQLLNQTIAAIDHWEVDNRRISATKYFRIYENTAPGCPLRHFVAKRCALHGPLMHPETYPRQLLIDILKIMRELHPCTAVEPLLNQGTEEFYVSEEQVSRC